MWGSMKTRAESRRTCIGASSKSSIIQPALQCSGGSSAEGKNTGRRCRFWVIGIQEISTRRSQNPPCPGAGKLLGHEAVRLFGQHSERPAGNSQRPRTPCLHFPQETVAHPHLCHNPELWDSLMVCLPKFSAYRLPSATLPSGCEEAVRKPIVTEWRRGGMQKKWHAPFIYTPSPAL